MNESSETSASVLDEFLGARPRIAWRHRAQWLAIGLSAVALPLLFIRFVSGSAATYVSEPLVRDDLPLRLAATGKLRPNDVTEIGSDLAGTVSAVFVAPGQRVAQGQLLASIDPRPFQEALARSQALIEARTERLANAEARASKAQSSLVLFEGVRRRSAGRVPSDREMTVARAERDRAQAEADAARLEIAPTQASLATARAQLAATEIRAPHAGVILERRVRPGDHLIGGRGAQPLFMLADDLSRLKLDILANQLPAARPSIGQRVRVTVAGFPGRSFTAIVEGAASYPALAPADRVDAPAPLFGMSLKVANPDGVLRPAPRVAVDIGLGLHRNVLVVPDTALSFARASGLQRETAPAMARPSEATILVMKKDGTARRIPVRLGGGDGRRTEVVSDSLEPGMRVIVGVR